MHSRTIPILILISVLLIVDIYSFQAVRLLSMSASVYWKRFSYSLFWLLSVTTVTVICVSALSNWHAWPTGFRTYLFASLFLLFFSKLIISIFLLADDLFRGGKWIAQTVTSDKKEGISRLKFISQAGMVVSGFFLFNFVYGMIKTGFNYRVYRIKLKVPNLPPAFAGIKIVQISDLHTGSFISTEPIARAIKMVNEEKADLIFFTGDLVNDGYTEAIPFKEILSTLKAPLGVYSILGNHDYGDYYKWKNVEEKQENLKRLKNFHGKLGWNILLNAHSFLKVSM